MGDVELKSSDPNIRFHRLTAVNDFVKYFFSKGDSVNIYIYNSVLTRRHIHINSSASTPPNATKIAEMKDSHHGQVIAYMSTQREVLEGQTGSHRAKRANFGRGARGYTPGKCQQPTLQMVQSLLFLSYRPIL